MTTALSLIAGAPDVTLTILVAVGIAVFYLPLDSMTKRILFERRVKRQGVSFDLDARSAFEFRRTQ